MTSLLLIVHVLFGFLCLALGLIAFTISKEKKAHALVGKMYFVSMTIIFITATIVSIMKSNLLLLLIGFFSFYLVYTGVRYNKVKLPFRAKSFDVASTILFSLAFISMLILGIIALLIYSSGYGVVLLVFSIIGIQLIYKDINFFIRKLKSSNLFWKKEHIGRMTGSYIAATTAFLVNNIQISPVYITWLAPTILGIPVILYFNRKYITKRI